MVTTAADPAELRRYADRLRASTADVHTPRLAHALTRLRWSRSEGIGPVPPLDVDVRVWHRHLDHLDDEVLGTADTFEAADRGTWAGTTTEAQRRAVALHLQRLRALAAGGSVPHIRRWAHDLTAAERRTLAWAYPELVGSLDGLPVTMRYQANAVLVERAIGRHAHTISTLQRAGLPGKHIEPFVERLRVITELATPMHDPSTCSLVPRQLLAFSPDGDGLAVQVLGDLDTADHVSVFVPGITNTLDNFLEGTAANATRIHGEVAVHAEGRSVATVAWLGYDTPGHLDAPSDATARGAGPELRAFVEALDLADDATTTIVGHSYGSLVTGHALLDGLAVDHVVVAGSPGMGVDHVHALHTDAAVYALHAPWDVVSASEWHGADPAEGRFGATPLRTGDAADGDPVAGHSGYFDLGSESLRNLALVIAGRGDEAATAGGLVDGVIGWLDDITGPFGPADDVADGLDLLRDAGRAGWSTIDRWVN